MQQPKHKVLIVDDEAGQRQFLRAVLEKSYAVVSAAGGDEARQLLSSQQFDLVITDQRMPGFTGIELVGWIRENRPHTPVIIMTAFGTIDSAVAAMKLGASDYLTKPVRSPDEIRFVVAKTLSKEVAGPAHRVASAAADEVVVAESAGMREALRLADQVAPQPTTVLITGESGTGKEVLARYIHRMSGVGEGPFVAVNCAALSEHLLESELFGHEKGAFTGATQSKQGRFEIADGGTLFLDEIGEMTWNLQSKLLRALQEQRFERVGGTRTISVNVRVIAATNRNLAEALEEKTFREDLYYRLSVFPIHLPPLRERREDILPLAQFFLLRFARRMNKAVEGFDAAARNRLLAYPWPGNIRELQNSIERALIVSSSAQITASDLPLKSPEGSAYASPSPAGDKTLADLEKEAILSALERNRGDRRAAAADLGISLRTLQYRLKDYGLTRRT